MDARQKAQLEALKQEQLELRLKLDSMARRIDDLETTVANEAVSITPLEARGEAAPETSLVTVPVAEVLPVNLQLMVPPPLPVRTFAVPSAQDPSVTESPAPMLAETITNPSEKLQDAAELPIASAIAAEKAKEASTVEPGENSFEMRLGTHWFVRVGAISILTGLVFLANYAYTNWVFAKSPVVKVTMLYLLSFGLSGTGWFLQRWQEQLRRYGQVLMATGLAAVYFTTYAAHYFTNLRIIESASLAGAMLLGIAGFMVWIADRKKSEPLALFAIGLAYYTSVINEIQEFTLFSNLALTVAAVFFLIRNRWATLSFASLVATYGAFFYWRFNQDQRWHWDFPMSPWDFWLGAQFLAGYWIIFSAPVFLSKHEQFKEGRRATFLTLNNGAFFGFTAWTLHLAYPGHFWQWSLCFGVILLALAALASRVVKDDPIARDAYTSKGLILITMGFLTHFSGEQLSLVLAGQSVAMLVMGYLRYNRIVRGGAYVVAGLSALLALDDFKPLEHNALLMGISVAVFLIFNGWWVNWNSDREDRAEMCPKISYFVGLGLFVGFLAAWHNVAAEWRAPLFAALALAFTGSWYALRLRELVTLGQWYLAAAQLIWVAQLAHQGNPWPWWNPAIVIGITLGLGHWWQRQKSMSITTELRNLLQAAGGLAVVLVLSAWLQPISTPEQWLWLTSLLAIALTGYGVATRAWYVAGCGQIFLLFSGGKFVELSTNGHPSWFLTLVPVATLAGLGLITLQVLRASDKVGSDVKQPVLQLSLVYRAVAVLMSVMWIVEYIPGQERFWVFALCGMALFLWAGWVKRQEAFWFSIVFTAVGFFHFTIHSAEPAMIYLPNILAILALGVQQQLARRHLVRSAEAEPLHTVAIMAVSAALWLFFTQWVHRAGSGFYHTAVWATLALVLFSVGLPLREGIYRRCGMALLVMALGRVALVDIWKLETIYKIISCIGLGVVLMVLGFIYNKYQEQIRRWL